MATRCEIGTNIFHHRLPVQMRFNDIDMLGHLNNSVYFTFFDLAKTRYFMEVLHGKVDWGKIGVAIVNVNCDFCAQTFFDDKIEVRTACVAIGEKSLTLEQVVCSDKGEIKAHCRTIMAAFNAETGTSAPIQQYWRDSLEAFEGRNLSKKSK